MANWWATATEEDRARFKEAVSKGKKKMRENFSNEEKEKHIRQLKENHKKGIKNKTEESKKAFSNKMSRILKERRKDKKYRKLMSTTVSHQMKKQRENYTEEEKEKKRQDIIDKARKFRDSLDEKGKQDYLNKMYQGRLKAAKKREEAGQIKRPCQFPQCTSGAKAISNINLEWEKRFIKNGFTPIKEFPVGDYCYDFKMGDTLIEINPYAYHNSTRAPKIPGAKPKDSMYHYHKAENAINKGYNIIEVWDWTKENEVINDLKSDKKHCLSIPKLNWYNPKTKDHIIDCGFNRDDMISKGYVEIYDC